MTHSPPTSRRCAPSARVLVAIVLAIALCAVALTGLPSSPALAATASCTPGAWPSADASLATQVVAQVNQYRGSLGLAQLTVDATLSDAATWKARHMAQYGYVEHDDPAPPVARTAYQRALDCGYSTAAEWGENIAAGQDTAADVMAAWIASAPHRENLQGAAFRAIGVGVAADASGRLYWVQDFGSAVVSAGVTPPPASAPVAAPPSAPPATPPPALPSPPATVVPPAAVVSPPAAGPAAVAPAVPATSATDAPTPPAAVPAKAALARRGARLHAARPHAGDVYRVRLSFGRVPVATAALSVRCRARLAGTRVRGAGAIAGHVATCAWRIPATARGRRLVVRVRISGRRGVSLARSARRLVGSSRAAASSSAVRCTALTIFA
jgi:uncharacterized protein YkwD